MGWDELEAERRQNDPVIWLTVKDNSGKVIRKIKAPAKKGMNRIAWDLQHASTQPIRPGQRGRRFSRGALAMPGTYSVALAKEIDGKVTPLTDPVEFEVVPLREPTLKGISAEEYVAFSDQLSAIQTDLAAVSTTLNESVEIVDAMTVALQRSSLEPGSMNEELYQLKQHIYQLDEQLNGNDSRSEIGERNPPTVRSRMFVGYRGLFNTYGPTPTHRKSLDIAKKELANIAEAVEKVSKEKIPKLEKALQEAGAPYIEGQAIQKN